MRSALYYPHTTVDSEEIIKTALLLWDRLEYIVPWPDFEVQYATPSVARAMELIGSEHPPGEDEKRAAHSRLQDLVSGKLPKQFYFKTKRNQPSEPYEMYPQKLSPDSWELLQQAQLSGKLLPNSDYPLSEFGGLMVMSILADCCAGTTRSRVTDQGDAYATITGTLGNDPTAAEVSKADSHGQLVPISLTILDTSPIPIDSLIRLREREEKESGHTLRDLRHRYVDGLETYVTRLAKEKSTKADANEIQRQFADDMKADLKDLRAELGFVSKDAVLSKEFFATVLTVAGTAASWLFGVPLPIEQVVTATGAPVAIGGLLGVRNKYLKERQAVLKKHPMSYLFEARRMRLM
jgi:hypothetical protein